MKLTRRSLLGASLAGLSGCGFQPVYMPSAGGTPGVVSRELPAIFVAIIPDRPGQLLRQALQQRLQGADGSVTPLYTLNVSYWISGEGIGIQPDNTATRVRLFGNANWALLSRDPSRQFITNGYSRVEDALNIFQNQYFGATLGTEVADRRIAESMADQICLRLAIFFRDQARRQHLG